MSEMVQSNLSNSTHTNATNAGATKNQFDNFREHSVAEFFKKNKQMLGFSGKVRSMTTIVHEYITNSLDACEEARILPDIYVAIDELKKETGHYRITIKDNGPGIPESHIGKALGMMLAGTKFHRYVQQRGQQGIGAAGCTMYALLTSGQPIKAISEYKGKRKEYLIKIDFKTNSPIVDKLSESTTETHGITIIAEFKDLKYEKGNRGPFEYLRRTVLVNPHTKITLVEPDGNITVFPRSTDKLPKRPREAKPHPLGITSHDLYELVKAKSDKYKRLSSLLQNELSRLSLTKIKELSQHLPNINFNMKPDLITWEDAEQIVRTFKKLKFLAPPMDVVIPIGKQNIENAFKTLFNPEFLSIVERPPKIYKGGIPFIVEVGIAYGGDISKLGKQGEIMRFANRVPLLFDTGGCAITTTLKNMDWKRYNLKNFEEEPIIVLVNLSSVYIPYTSAGKQAISDEEDIIIEIKNAVMEAARGIKRYLSGKRSAKELAHKKKAILRYVDELSSDLELITGINKESLKSNLLKIIESKFVMHREKGLLNKNKDNSPSNDKNDKNDKNEKDNGDVNE